MQYIRAMVAAGIFIVLTAIKILSPGLATGMRDQVSEVIDSNTDYRAVVTALGQSLTGREDGVFPASLVAEQEPTPAPEAKPPLVVKTPEMLLASTPGRSLAGLEEIEPGTGTETPPLAAPGDAEEVDEAAVAAFLQSQARFDAYAVPANVSYNMPALPFSYASPAGGGNSSGFGYRLHPLFNEVKFHYGTDIAANSGDNIYAFASGSASEVGENDGYGKFVVLEHEGGYRTLYAHCSHIYIQTGQTVEMGEKIALSGATGQVTGPHLHFELLHGETYLNPEFYLTMLQ